MGDATHFYVSILSILERQMKRIAVLLFPLSLGGCIVAAEKPNFDTRLIAPAAPIPKDKSTAPKPLAQPKPCSAGDPTQPADRNACIYVVKSSIDDSYLNYRLQIAKEVGLTTEGLDVGSTASSAAATATTGVATKVLSGLATTLTGTRTAFNNDALYQQSLQVIFKQMEADRSNVWTNIEISMLTDMSAYPMAKADNDLLAYFRAGTIEDALSALDANAGTAATTCQAASKAVSNVTTTAGATGAGAAPAAAKALAQPAASSTGAQQPTATSTTEQCSQVVQAAAKYALGQLTPKSTTVADEEATISKNIKLITSDKKAELDDIAKALGVTVSADYATERGAVVAALSAITDSDKLADAASRIQTATGQDLTK